MAVYSFASFQVFNVLPFDPLADRIDFSGTGISAADFNFQVNDGHGGDSDISFFVGGKLIQLLVDPTRFSASSFIFDDASVALIGDNSSGIRDDDFPNTLPGSGGDDFVVGLGGADSVTGGAGNDVFYTIRGRTVSNHVGNDTLDGGAGVDRLQIHDLEGPEVTIQTASVGGGQTSSQLGGELSGSVSVNLLTGIATLPQFDGTSVITVTLTIPGFEYVIGLDAPSSITGNNDANFLSGGYGNDTLTGNGGNDTLLGGAGNDTLSGGDGDDLLRGQFGADSIQGGLGNDTIRGYGRPGDTMDGGDGTADVLENAFHESSLFDASNIERLTLLGGVNVMADGGLDQILSGDASHIRGWDELFDLYVTWAEGNNSANLITGSNGDNGLAGAGGNDTLDGMGGFDIAVYDHETNDAAIVATLNATTGAGSVTVAGGGNVDTLQNIEGIAGGYGNDSITGGLGNELLYGGDGNDTLIGGAGSDTIFGRAGNDSMDGGEGLADWLALSGAHAGVTVDLSLLTGQVIDGGEGDKDTAVNFENLAGGQFDDVLIGSSVANTIYGADGDDTIDGGAGNDSLDGGEGTDSVSYAGSGSSVTVHLGTGSVTGGMGLDTLSRVENVDGSKFNDTLIGSAGNNIFVGGLGNDSIVGGAGFDTADYYDSETGVSVNLETGAVSGGAGIDTLAGIEAVIGSWEGDDTLTGRSLAAGEIEILAGLGGNDTITGGGGAGFTLVSFEDTGTVTATMDAGAVTVTAPPASVGNDSITNVDGMVGSGGADSLSGDGNDNYFIGGAGSDSLNGAGGNDWVSFVDASDPVFANLGSAPVTMNGTAVGAGLALDGIDSNATLAGVQSGTDTLVSIENLIGGSGGDNLGGGDGANILEGGGGNDTLFGGRANDTLDGGGGRSDLVDYSRSTTPVVVNLGSSPIVFSGHATFGNATVAGSTALDGIDTNGSTLDGVQAGIDSLTGIEEIRGTFNGDYLRGSDTSASYTGRMGDPINAYQLGNQNTVGGAGNVDTIDGGSTSWADFDQINYSGFSTGVYVDLRDGTASVMTAPFSFGAQIATLSNIDFVVGTGGADSLAGGSDSRTFNGARFELFNGGAGNDTIQGRGGVDWVDIFDPTQNVHVDLSNQSGGFGFSGNNDGFGGRDSYQGIEGVRVLGSAATNDTMLGGQNDREYFMGGAGNDLFVGGEGFDVAMYLSSPNAVFVDLSLAVAFDGFIRFNTDQWSSFDSLFEVEGAWGSDFDDTLIGAAGGDELYEEFEGRAGNDLIDGNDGFVPQTPGQALILNDLASFSNSVSAVLVDLAAGFANDGYGGTDTLIGIEGARGSRFGDTLLGGNAAHDSFEFFEGGAGNDSINGGSGNDWILFDFTYAGVSVDLGSNTVLNDGWGGVDTLVSIEHVSGSDYADSIVGSSASNVLHGSDGDDTLRGGAGNDQLIGTDYGNDQFDAPQSDWADFSDATTALSASLVSGTAFSTTTGLDTLAFIANLRGGSGNDTLTGNAGDNWLQGGAGNDLLLGGAGRDVASYADATGNLSITIGTGTWTATDGSGNTDTLVDIEGVAGGSGNDTLTGNASDNFFDGGAGNDSITGGGGFDWLDYSRSGSAVTVNLLAGTSSGGMGADAISGIEAVRGTRYADTFISSNAGILEFYAPNGGNDTVTGSTNPSATTVLSFRDLQASLDTTGGTFGVDLSLGGGSGTLRVEHEWDIGTIDIITYTGIDGVYGGRWSDNLVGNSGNNWFNGGHGADVLDAGTLGFDILSYREALNPILANLTSNPLSRNYTFADGTFIGSVTVAGAHVLDGNGGADQIYMDALNGDFEQLEGGAHNDTVAGSAANNVFFGHEGDDWLAGGLGNDTLDGGAGVDRVFFLGAVNNTVSGAVVDLQAGTAVSVDGNDTLVSIEGVQGTAGNDSFTGRDDYLVQGMQTRDLFETYQPLRGADQIDGGGTGWGQTDILDLNGFTSGINQPTVGVNANLGAGTVSNDGFGTVDTLTANTIDQVHGNAFNDTLVGGSSSRTSTGALFEAFRGNAGADSINGMGGEDRADYINSGAAVVVNLGGTARSLAGTPYASLGTIAAGRALDGQDSATGTAGTQPYIDTLVNIEQVRGTVYSDFFFGGGSHNASATGVDRFYDYEAFEGLEGNDFIDGGAGNDVAIYSRSTGAVIVNLGAGLLVVGPYTVAAGKAHDGHGTVDTLVSIEVVVGSDYGDYIQGGAGNDQFRAGAGNDTLHGGAGNDRLNYSGSPNAVFVDLANGTATDGFDGDLLTAGVQAWTDTFTGFEAVRGSHHDDTLLGTTGDDTLEGLGGADLLNGGEGIDTVTFRFEQQHGSALGVIVNLSEGDYVSGVITVQGGHALDGFDTVNGGPARAQDTLVSIEQITGSTFNDTLIGGAEDNFFEGETGNDLIDGGDGNDTASYRNATGGVAVNFAANTVGGSAGSDTLVDIETVEGSSFNDSYTVAGAANVIVEHADGGIDTVSASDDYTLGADLESLVLLGTDSLSGTGNAGNNTIQGNAGGNTLDGGLGNDSLIGGLGNDVYFVDSLGDGVVETSVAGAGNADEVRVAGIDYTLGANIENGRIVGATGRLLNGNALNNTLRGGSGLDSLRGGAGNDTYIIDDTINGAHEISGLSPTVGATVLELPGAGNADTVISYVSNIRPLASQIENLTLSEGAPGALTGTGNTANNLIIGNSLENNLFGGAGNDTLQGGGGGDRLYGNDGNDSLVGGDGDDTLYGGAGADRYILDSGNDVVIETGGTNDDFGEQRTESFDQRQSGQGIDRFLMTGDAAEFQGNDRATRIEAGTGDQTVRTGGGQDTVATGVGDDVIVLESANAIVDGGADTDRIELRFSYTLNPTLEDLKFYDPVAPGDPGNYVGVGNASINVMEGNVGHNRLAGLANDDTLLGGLGNDTLEPGTGNDSIDGGDNSDWVSYGAEAAAVTIDLGAGSAISTIVGGTGTDTLTSIENAIGSKGNDGITGTSLANALLGDAGNDTLTGLGGEDTLDGGLGIDSMVGGADNDTYTVDAATDTVVEAEGGGDNDLVRASVNHTLALNVESLLLTGTAALNGTGNGGVNTLTGNSAANVLDGKDGADSMVGGAGNDTYKIDAVGDTIVEVANGGIDTVVSDTLATYTLANEVENLTLTRALGVTAAVGNSANNVITTGLGNDTLDGKGGNDTMNGGAGVDLYLVDSQGDVIIDSAGTEDSVLASVTYNFSANAAIEGAQAAAGLDDIGLTANAAHNVLIGNDGDNSLSGGAGNDTIYGSANILDGLGDDTLDGGAGADSLFGGAGNDTYTVDALADVVSDLLGDDDLVRTSVANATGNTFLLSHGNIVGIEHVVLLGSVANAIGTTADNSMVGTTGNNVLNGLAGIDTMAGLAGNDIYGVDDKDDVVIESPSIAGGIDTIVLTTAMTYALEEGAGVENLVLDTSVTLGGALSGTNSNNGLSGSDGNDTLLGLAGNDTMFGDDTQDGTANDGNDSLDGGLGNDSMVGHGGNDTYVVNAAGDLVVEAATAAGGIDTIRTTFANAAGNTYSIAALAAIENVILDGAVANAIGNTGNNSITGSSGNNSLSGGTGNDTLDGGAGDDTLEGGAGSDSLVGGDGGSDWVSYLNETASVSVTAGNFSSGTGAAAGDTLVGIENLLGGRGNDGLHGDAGANFLDGSLGADFLDGNGGNDTFGVDNVLDSVSASGVGVETVRSSVNFTLVQGGLTPNTPLVDGTIENLVLLGSAVFGFGNHVANRIEGNASNNSLAGADGNDTLVGGGGNDTLSGGGDYDTADYSAAPGAIFVTISASNDVSVSGGAGNDALGDVESIAGSAGSDWVIFTDPNGVQADVFGESTVFDFSSIENLRGGAGNDTLTGCADANILQGGLGNDVLDGEDDIDTASYAEATAAVTVVLAGASDGSATGGAGVDVLRNIENIIGGSGNDNLTGDEFANILDGGLGNDILTGGAGNDIYIVNAVGDRVHETGTDALDEVQSLQTISLAAAGIVETGFGAIENVTLLGTAAINATGNGLANVLTGNSAVNNLLGEGGNDTLNGGVGADSMRGGTGNDTYRVDNTADRADETGGDGHDQVFSTASFVLTGAETTAVEDLYLHIEGDSSATTSINGTGNAEANLIEGNNGLNSLVGGAGNDTLRGLNGNDTLVGGDGVDSMEGGLGNDLFVVNSLDDIVVEEAAAGDADTVNATLGALDTWELLPNFENLVLLGTTSSGGIGNASNNLMVGNAADNFLSGGAGNDTLRGGAGNDTYLIDTPYDVVDETIAGSAGTADTVRVIDFDYTLGANLEHLIFWAGSPDGFVGAGNALNNSIQGGLGNDSLLGDAGNDTLNGFFGDDLTTGGLGNDMHIVDSLADVVVELAGGGIDTLASQFINLDLNLAGYANFENLALIGSYAGTLTGNNNPNQLTGSSGDNTLLGGAGNDTLQGNAGNDSLTGGAGIDSMVGGEGNDTYVTDVAGDVIVEANTVAGGMDTVIAGAGNSGATIFTIAARPELEHVELAGAVLNAIGNGRDNSLVGNALNNSLSGAAGNDTLVGGAGNDVLDGGLGTDELSGGSGNDSYFVDAGDVVTELTGEGIDTVSTGLATYVLGDFLENLILTGAIQTSATGNEENNSIVAGAGNTTLSGGDGNDTLSGGLGNDTLVGGDDNDVFIFDAPDSVNGGAGEDTIRVAGTLGTATAPFDFGTIAARLDDIEVVDITGTGNNGIRIDIDDVLSISDTTKTLRIHGNANDFVRSGDLWTLQGQISVGEDYYFVYDFLGESGLVTLQVHESVTQIIPLAVPLTSEP